MGSLSFTYVVSMISSISNKLYTGQLEELLPGIGENCKFGLRGCLKLPSWGLEIAGFLGKPQSALCWWKRRRAAREQTPVLRTWNRNAAINRSHLQYRGGAFRIDLLDTESTHNCKLRQNGRMICIQVDNTHKHARLGRYLPAAGEWGCSSLGGYSDTR